MNQHFDENVSNFIVEAEPTEFEMDQMLGNNFIAYLSTDQNPKELFEAQSGSNAEATRQVIEANADEYPFAEKTSTCESGMHEDSGNRKEIEMTANNQNDDGSKSEEISRGRKRFQRKEDATQVKIKRVREKHPLRESCRSNCRL